MRDFLSRGAARDPDAVCLVVGEERLSYAQLRTRTERFAAGLIDHGVGPGDRVVICLENSLEEVVALFGTVAAGAVFVLIRPEASSRRLNEILIDSGAKAVVLDRRRSFVGPRGASRLHFDEVSVDATTEGPRITRAGSDLCCLIYTSGSTGRQKGVMLSYDNVTFAEDSIAEYLEVDENDVVMNAIPLSFDYGLYNLLMPIRRGATVVVEPSIAAPYTLMGRARREGVTLLPLIPAAIAMLLRFRDQDRFAVPSLRAITTTGQALPREHARRLGELFPSARIFSMYGLTECKRISYLPPERLREKPDSVGIPIPRTSAWIVDDRGDPITEPGRTGELVVEGRHVMLGYWGQPGATAEVLSEGDEAGARRLSTGDLFRRDAEGLLYFVARKDRLIKVGAERVSPAEVENVLCELDGVVEAAAYGVPHEILGQVIEAVVAVDDASVTEDVVLAHAKAALEPHLVPKTIRSRARLPHTPNGKVDVAALLREREAASTERSNPLEDRAGVLGKSWKKLKRLHPLEIDLGRVELVRGRDVAELSDPQRLEALLLELGLNDDGLMEFPEELHRYCGEGLRIWQYPIQFARYLADLSGLGVRSYLELGTRHGGTFVATVEVLNRFRRLDRAVGVDIMPCPSLVEYARHVSTVSFARMNTQTDEFAEFVRSTPRFDLVLVDANHTELECRREVELMREHADVLALHDIVNIDFPGVGAVWSELVATGEYECREYAAQYEGIGPYMGIGLAIRKDRADRQREPS